jgi:hypothetical protein
MRSLPGHDPICIIVDALNERFNLSGTPPPTREDLVEELVDTIETSEYLSLCDHFMRAHWPPAASIVCV